MANSDDIQLPPPAGTVWGHGPYYWPEQVRRAILADRAFGGRGGMIWIPVTERLPEVGQEVLMWVAAEVRGESDDGREIGRDVSQVAMGNCMLGEGGPYLSCYVSPFADFEHITHWMPLPTAPDARVPDKLGGEPVPRPHCDDPDRCRQFGFCRRHPHPTCGVAPQKPDLSGCEVMADGEGVSLESGKPFGFTCCDCGLTHRCVIVSEDGNPVGFAVERDQQATDEKRTSGVMVNGLTEEETSATASVFGLTSSTN